MLTDGHPEVSVCSSSHHCSDDTESHYWQMRPFGCDCLKTQLAAKEAELLRRDDEIAKIAETAERFADERDAARAERDRLLAVQSQQVAEIGRMAERLGEMGKAVEYLQDFEKNWGPRERKIKELYGILDEIRTALAKQTTTRWSREKEKP